MNGIPLVWQFAEPAETAVDDVEVFYDGALCLNMVKIDGATRPVVEVKDISLATSTATGKPEETDQDFTDFTSIYGTATTTKAQPEETDSD